MLMRRTRRKADKVGVMLRGLFPPHTAIYLLLVCMCLGMYAWTGGEMDGKGPGEIGTARISVAPTLGQQQQQQQQHNHGRGGGDKSDSEDDRKRKRERAAET